MFNHQKYTVMKTTKIIVPIIVMSIIGILHSCDKKELKSKLKIEMTDAPALYQEVNVDVQRIDVHYTKDDKWVSVETNAGVYDLLTLQNGVTTVIVDDNALPAGEINEIRLVLGPNNTIKVAGVLYPLKVPSGMQSGIKIKVNKKLNIANTTYILIDFDAEKSVTVTGKDTYLLNPVIIALQ